MLFLLQSEPSLLHNARLKNLTLIFCYHISQKFQKEFRLSVPHGCFWSVTSNIGVGQPLTYRRDGMKAA